MSSYIDQIRRMREARELDENPLVEALNRVVGVRAWVNDEGGAEGNRKDGDVMFAFLDPIPEPKFKDAGLVRRIESQVSRKHTKFSYSYDKLGKYEGEWVYLACLERPGPGGIYSGTLDNPIPMIHVILYREELDKILEKVAASEISHGGWGVKGVYLNEKDGRKFFTIYPTALAGCESAMFGSSIDGVVADLIERIRKEPAQET